MKRKKKRIAYDTREQLNENSARVETKRDIVERSKQ